MVEVYNSREVNVPDSITNSSKDGGLDSDYYDVFLDITSDVCPMTFVKTKILIEKMSKGQIAEVRLNDGEPLHNVPKSVREHGHDVLSLEPEQPGGRIYRLRLRKTA